MLGVGFFQVYCTGRGKEERKSGAGSIKRKENNDMAEKQGFEPWVGLPPQRFSRPSRSTAPALLHVGPIDTVFWQGRQQLRELLTLPWPGVKHGATLPL